MLIIFNCYYLLYGPQSICLCVNDSGLDTIALVWNTMQEHEQKGNTGLGNKVNYRVLYKVCNISILNAMKIHEIETTLDIAYLEHIYSK